eukprot:TRINITY_DN17381_c0_g1::TRINITY_DN17381_c0_g1_i1::g.17992::m.17992 TRINITY_DN17381_c0_g1::TRINITY_DN17381_c0_g1_i1::g.17992  ORF type:complete len:275 (+),score=33.62,DUF4586/PF15239.1/7.6e-07 TRINITY_DN17381_c0_g1_i1:54-878(+)
MVVNRDYLGLGREKEFFSTPTYITIEDPFIDPTKKGVSDRYKGKQFLTKPPKEGLSGSCMMDALFQKQFLMLFDKAPFQDPKVFNANAERKLGFLSSVPHQRDEFSNTIRTEQWRATLHREDEIRKKYPVPEYHARPKSDEGPKLSEVLGVPKHTYDIISRRPEDGAHTTNKLDNKYASWDAKSHRDRFYTQRTLRGDPDSIKPDSFPSKLRRKCKLSSSSYGSTAWESTKTYQPSEYVRRPIIADSFYRDSGVLPTDDLFNNNSMFFVTASAS